MNDVPSGAELERRMNLAVMTDDEIERTFRLAKGLAESGLFPDARTAAAAFAKVLVGRDLGLTPTHAMTGVHIVEGKPMIGATTLAGFVRQHPSYEYSINEHDETKCSLLFWQSGDELGVSTFTIDEAKQAGLGKWPDEDKWARSQWGKWPKNMLFARAMSNGVRWFCADVFGGVPVYSEGDEFTVREAGLTAGTSGDAPEPLNLGVDVERVIARATELSHVGLSDRPTIEMMLGGRSADVVKGWVETAEAELDEAEAAQSAQSS